MAGRFGMTSLFLSGLVGKLRLGARKVVEPVMAVLTLKGDASSPSRPKSILGRRNSKCKIPEAL